MGYSLVALWEWSIVTLLICDMHFGFFLVAAADEGASEVHCQTEMLQGRPHSRAPSGAAACTAGAEGLF